MSVGTSETGAVAPEPGGSPNAAGRRPGSLLSRTRAALAGLLAAALSGCALGPDYVRPESATTLPAEFAPGSARLASGKADAGPARTAPRFTCTACGGCTVAGSRRQHVPLGCGHGRRCTDQPSTRAAATSSEW